MILSCLWILDLAPSIIVSSLKRRSITNNEFVIITRANHDIHGCACGAGNRLGRALAGPIFDDDLRRVLHQTDVNFVHVDPTEIVHRGRQSPSPLSRHSRSYQDEVCEGLPPWRARRFTERISRGKSGPPKENNIVAQKDRFRSQLRLIRVVELNNASVGCG